MPPAFRSHRISLSVADLDAEQAWYRDALGLTRKTMSASSCLRRASGRRCRRRRPAGRADPTRGLHPGAAPTHTATTAQTFTRLALQVPTSTPPSGG